MYKNIYFTNTIVRGDNYKKCWLYDAWNGYGWCRNGCIYVSWK